MPLSTTHVSGNSGDSEVTEAEDAAEAVSSVGSSVGSSWDSASSVSQKLTPEPMASQTRTHKNHNPPGAILRRTNSDCTLGSAWVCCANFGSFEGRLTVIYQFTLAYQGPLVIPWVKKVGMGRERGDFVCWFLDLELGVCMTNQSRKCQAQVCSNGTSRKTTWGQSWPKNYQ